MRRFVFATIAFLLILLLPTPAAADSPIVGEIRLWAGTPGSPAPGWREANGVCLSRSDYADLFTLIGVQYGATCGSTMFPLPNLRGRIAVGQSFLEDEFDTLGETGGEKTHTLTIAEMPSHNHRVNYLDKRYSYNSNGYADGGTGNTASPYYTQPTGGGAAHNNLQPYIVLSYIIYVGGASAPTATATATPLATYTPRPTYTPVNTYTPHPTYTTVPPAATYTPVNTYTPNPTYTTVPPAATYTPEPTYTPPAIAPTYTPMPTYTPGPSGGITNTLYLPYLSAYTYTLTSGEILTVPVSVSFGQIFIASAAFLAVAALGLSLLRRL